MKETNEQLIATEFTQKHHKTILEQFSWNLQLRPTIYVKCEFAWKTVKDESEWVMRLEAG